MSTFKTDQRNDGLDRSLTWEVNTPETRNGLDGMIRHLIQLRLLVIEASHPDTSPERRNELNQAAQGLVDELNTASAELDIDGLQALTTALLQARQTPQVQSH